MTSNKYFFLHLLLAVALLNTSSSQSIVTVAPTTPTEKSIDPESVLTFTQYLSKASDSAVFNISNTTIEFLPGEHEINGLLVRQIVVFSVSNIMWRGFPAKQPVLKCKQKFALVFKEEVLISH